MTTLRPVALITGGNAMRARVAKQAAARQARHGWDAKTVYENYDKAAVPAGLPEWVVQIRRHEEERAARVMAFRAAQAKSSGWKGHDPDRRAANDAAEQRIERIRLLKNARVASR